MAQQARPKVIGQTELLRTQFTAKSSEVMTTPSGCSYPKFTSWTFSRFLPLDSRFPKRYRSVNGTLISNTIRHLLRRFRELWPYSKGLEKPRGRVRARA